MASAAAEKALIEIGELEWAAECLGKSMAKDKKTPRPRAATPKGIRDYFGAEVTELIQGYIVGRQLETTEEDLMHTVFPHPTISEAMHESVLDAYDRVIHI